jgi:demethylmenaquinone methyltransferase/2-methoxy-6-polyprenyl-1,4-benzoquinol methylase
VNDPDIGTFDRFARLYDLAMPPASKRALAEGLARAERPVHRALDVGGGTGRAGAAVRPETVVVDASIPMLRRARAKGQGAVAGDATRLPVADSSVDAVFVVDALHHMPDHPAVFAELARVLRPGGVAVVREFDPTTLRGRLLVAAEHAWGFASTFHPPAELANGLSGAGLAASVLDEGFGYTVVGVAGDGPEACGERRGGSGRHKSAGARADV